jgi:hypothetical protein
MGYLSAPGDHRRDDAENGYDEERGDEEGVELLVFHVCASRFDGLRLLEGDESPEDSTVCVVEMLDDVSVCERCRLVFEHSILDFEDKPLGFSQLRIQRFLFHV